jgi:hypothetical protein
MNRSPMMRTQFRVLYRQFLFRVVDLELLSPQGEMSKLLGQFAALLIFLSCMFSVPAIGVGDVNGPVGEQTLTIWSDEHLLIATTMLVVGIFAVLSWDSTFPDRRDVLVLAPLPIRSRTIFLAKVAAVATALSLTVLMFHAAAGIVWPLALASGGVLKLARLFAAYWITMFAAGAFIFGCILTVQGLATQFLSRRQFLRLSSFLQLTAFTLFVSVYFLQPMMMTPAVLAAAQGHGYLAWSPSYWFLGLFQQMDGSSALASLARRAWIGLVVVSCGTVLAYTLSYLRTLRRIVEEPDIVPRSRGASWLPRFGNPLQTAVVQFSTRTLLRSRQHRVILAFYVGVGFAITTGFASADWHQVNVPLLASSILMMGFWVVGTRVAFSMPLDVRANWIFRIVPPPVGRECLAARRRSLLVLAVAPVWAASAVLFLSLWPCRPALGHLAVLGLVGVILAEICLHGIQKIPFTCSYLPGKSQVHMGFLFLIGMIVILVDSAAEFERPALDHPAKLLAMLAVLVAVAACARLRMSVVAKSQEGELQFDDLPTPAVLILGLHGD